MSADYLGIAHLPELVAAGVASLKIEGRMKNPDYVFNVVRVWRRRSICCAMAHGMPMRCRRLSASWEGRSTAALPMRICGAVRAPSS
ncbi:MAG: U32 family peptidase [Collinsella sp.]